MLITIETLVIPIWAFIAAFVRYIIIIQGGVI
jgi:hypothetical protein